MCGEHQNASRLSHGPLGSSPHVRGALRPSATIGLGCGIIPACAGSTLFCHRFFGRFRDHPRMCGEHLPESAICGHSRGSSPHVRGAQNLLPIMQDLDGIIPACAGSTPDAVNGICMLRDHPRMCGEHFGVAQFVGREQGSSPHVRGAHFENSIIPRKRKDNWLFFIQFRFENFLAFRYLLALLHPFLGVPTKDPSFASLGRLINCNPSQSTGDQSAPYTLKAICCSFLAE